MHRKRKAEHTREAEDEKSAISEKLHMVMRRGNENGRGNKKAEL